MMIRIPVSGFIETKNLLDENNLCANQMIDVSIGNDERIYCLFVKNVPKRINGMFEPTINHSQYNAISFDVDWYSGEVYGNDIIDFGLLSVNIHFIQPIGENFLLLGARAMRYKNGSTDKNALIIDRFRKNIRSLCIGDGIGHCIVDSRNNIITGYFDEGVFGNNGWDKPIGSHGLVKWSETGEKLWENKNYDICDCYAMNIDEQDNLWFYYYTDFNLVKTDYQLDVVYAPYIKGSHGFLISKSQTAVLFHKGYNKKGFCVMKKNYDQLKRPSDCKIVFVDREIDIERFSFRSSKAVFVDVNGELFFMDWLYG